MHHTGMAFQAIYLVGGDDDPPVVYTFEDIGQFCDWSDEVSNIKHLIADINNLNRFVDRNYAPWLGRVTAFKNKWGVPRVPLDIIVACRDVETQLGLIVGGYWGNRFP